MNFIHKQNEPVEFSEWKKTIDTPGNSGQWDDFRQPEKGIVLQSLLGEQGFVCCYCEQKVSPTDSHIEHLKPQQFFPEERFDYLNILASCNGNGNNHCGQRKGNWYDPSLFTSPLDADCMTHFKFTSAGAIKPTNDPAKHPVASETIARLNLNTPSLIDKRKRVLKELIIEGISTEELKTIKEKYSFRNFSGQFDPFRAFVDYILGIYTTTPTLP